MKKALINPIDLIEGYPSVVSVNDIEFEVTPAYYWIDCPDNVEAGMYYKDNQFYAPSEPTPEPHVATLEENKLRALERLKNTDWVEIPSVTDINNNPHLLNYNEFLVFRLDARRKVINPQAGNLEWPQKPKEQWSS